MPRSNRWGAEAEQLLLLGVRAMARAGAQPYDVAGDMDKSANVGSHFGAAACSTAEMLLDAAVAPDVKPAMLREIYALMAKHPFFFDGSSDEADEVETSTEVVPLQDVIDRVREAMEANVDNLVVLGHNVIFPTIALKALSLLPPHRCTAPVAAGIVSICHHYDGEGPFGALMGAGVSASAAAAYGGDDVALAAAALGAFAALEEFRPRTLGLHGHILTMAHGIIRLRSIPGMADLASRAEEAHRKYVAMASMDPSFGSTGPTLSLSFPSGEPYTEKAYWDADHSSLSSWAVGHSFKYAHSVESLLALAAAGGEAVGVDAARVRRNFQLLLSGEPSPLPYSFVASPPAAAEG